jgi:hypothetical protein
VTAHNQQDAVPANAQDQQAADAVAASRRRFIRTGATGAVLTLASGSGMATVCTVPSGAMNSRSPLDNTCTGGMSPGYWKNHPDAWPNGALSKTTTPFGNVFQSTGLMATLPLLDAVSAESDLRKAADPKNKCFHFTATYLNILAGYVKFLTVDQLKLMWNELEVYNAYVPAAGAEPWGKDQVLDYLESTYHESISAPPKNKR